MGEETARRYAEAQLLVGFMVADYLLGRGSGGIYTQAEEFQAPLGPKLIKRIRRKELRNDEAAAPSRDRQQAREVTRPVGDQVGRRT